MNTNNFSEILETGKTNNPVELKVIEMVKMGNFWKLSPDYKSPCGHPPVINARGRCAFCFVENQFDVKLEEKISRLETELEALKRQKMSHQMGVYLPQPGCESLYNMSSNIPKQTTPRAKAIAAGEKWYTPDEPCPKCGTLSPRYVANGRCKGCPQ
mgnify:CR=1 FL=1